MPVFRAAENALIFLVEDPDTAVLLREGLAEAGAFVRAAVVDQKQLEVRERLRQKAVDAVGQILLRPVHRYDHTDARRCRDPHPQTSKIKSTTEREYRSGWEQRSLQEKPWMRGMVWPDILAPVPCTASVGLSKHLVQREIQRKQQVFLSERARQEGA